MGDSNSLDAEFEPGPSTTPAKVDKLTMQPIANAEKDRLSSTRTVEQFTSAARTPLDRKFEQLWLDRFTAFRENNLKQSSKQPFTAEDMTRFFDCMLHLKLTGPEDGPIWKAGRVLIAYGHFMWPGFRFSKHASLRFQAFMLDCKQDGRVTSVP